MITVVVEYRDESITEIPPGWEWGAPTLHWSPNRTNRCPPCRKRSRRNWVCGVDTSGWLLILPKLLKLLPIKCILSSSSCIFMMGSPRYRGIRLWGNNISACRPDWIIGCWMICSQLGGPIHIKAQNWMHRRGSNLWARPASRADY